MKTYTRLQKILKPAVLAVMDEMSMIGRMFMGKILHRVENVLGASPRHYGKVVSLGGLDAVVTSHPAQIKSVGDDYWWKEGPYKGRAKNLPPRQSEAADDAPRPEEFVSFARMFLSEFDDVVILQKLQRLHEGDESMPPGQRAAYQQEAERWRAATRRVADQEWDEKEHL